MKKRRHINQLCKIVANVYVAFIVRSTKFRGKFEGVSA